MSRLRNLYLLDIHTRANADFLPVRRFPVNSRMKNFIPKNELLQTVSTRRTSENAHRLDEEA